MCNLPDGRRRDLRVVDSVAEELALGGCRPPTLADYSGKLVLVRSRLDGWVGCLREAADQSAGRCRLDEAGRVFAGDVPAVLDVLEVVQLGEAARNESRVVERPGEPPRGQTRRRRG